MEKKVEQVESSEKFVEDANKVLKGLEEHIRKGATERGEVTTTIVRKTLDLANATNSYLEFKLKFAYMVARNIPGGKRGTSFIEKFYENLTNVSRGREMGELRRLMEYVVMKHTVLAKLE
nr:hypothetical protein [Candidatus Njordarchaeota archaeon]